jgi:uncharacterized protein (TIGR03382 family)
MKKFFAAVAFAGAALAASPALAQRDMQLDVNDLGFQAYAGPNGTGGTAPFGGLTHTGSLVLQNIAGSVLNDIAMRTGGPGNPFIPQAFAGSLSGANIVINLNAGNVTGGSLMLQVGANTYTTLIGAAGNVTTYVGGGFKIDALTQAGSFNANTFAAVPIADFFANSGFLPGSFLNFRIIPNAGGAGTSDIDIFVSNIPAPGSLAVLGLGGLAAARRRRR